MNLHRGHDRPGRAVTAPIDHALHRICLPLEDGFHPTVPAVAHPAGHAQMVGLAGTGVAKEHALDPATDVHVTPNSHRVDRLALTPLRLVGVIAE